MYCVDLNITLPIFNTILTPVAFLKSRSSWADNINSNKTIAKHFKLNYATEVHQEVKDFFYKHNFFIELIEIFYLFPNDVMAIHTDRSVPGDFSKLNWIYGGQDSVMNWYKVINGPSNRAPLYTTPINSPSLQYAPGEVELVNTQQVGRPSLVQVGCPHNIVNGPEERFCVSVVFKHKSTNKRVTMEEAIAEFREYIK
jgi:hypothetical protein